MSYSMKIIKALEALWPKNVETQTDLIARMLAEVPAGEHEAVMHDCAVYCVMSNRSDCMKNVSWGDEAVYQAEAKDNRFVALSTGEWERTKMLAKRSAWFASWAEWKEWADRINGKRRTSRPASPPREVISRDPDTVGMLLEEREDVFRCPQMHVKTEAEAVALICELENAIVRWGGKARLSKVIDAEWDEEVAAEAKEDARREADYSEFPGLAAFIKSCGEPCKLVME